MYLRQFRSFGFGRLFPSYIRQTSFAFSGGYDRRKTERYEAKIRENFKAEPKALISETIAIDALVPNLFTNELALQKYPETPTVDKHANYFLNSYSKVTLPLATNPKLRVKLNRLFDNQVRIGRIFELMDSIAGIVSYSHCYGGIKPGSEPNQMVCVTGSVESLHLFGQIDIAKDLAIEGYLNHVGRTSMEIQINVLQEGQLKANSQFTMVSRKASDPRQGYQVPSLSFQGLSQEEQLKALTRKENAETNVLRRREEMNNSYDKKAPTLEDIQEIHKVFLSRKGKSTGKTSPISSSLVSTCEVMHTQSRNIHGKIFGGFLIKEMIELGWVAACKYAEEMTVIEDVTNIYFKVPVDIGCRLTLRATVTYVEGERLVMTVEAYTSKFTEKAETLACYLHLVAKSKSAAREVHPQSYEQSLHYLSSRKAFAELFH